MNKFKKVARYAFLIFSIQLAGCATTANYEKKLNSWVGFSELELVRSWGPPDASYEIGVSKYITWSKSGSIYIPQTNPTMYSTIIGNQIFTNAYGGSAAQNISLQCKTTFEIKNNYVVSWRWEGNSCKSKE
jgi:hypothetical protein